MFVRRPRIALALAAALALGGVTVVSWTPPAEAAPVSIVVDKSAPASVLVGAPITYSVTASNPADAGDADFQYNLTFRDVLPAGVTYVSTSAPAGLGHPQQIAEIGANSLPTGRTILIWSNVADLPDGSDVTVTYQVQPEADVYPVGAQVQNLVTGYASGNERALAKFDAAGNQVTAAAIQHADASSTTAISAIQLNKSEPSSEHELVRGVHDHTTTYTLTATNNGMMATTDVKVVDYLPAGLEFLGCGQVDNSVAGFEEYPGSGRLTSTPSVTAGDGCLAPFSVTTVNTDLPSGYPAGVYTRVDWRLPTLAANGSRTIRYRAGIPLRQNVMPAAGFVSTANLQNNTGSSTRETGTEIGLTNRATASGTYQGVNAQGQTGFVVADAASASVTSEDLALEKSIKGAAAFSQGGEAEYSLLVRTGEYADASDIVLVDTMPDGLCPSDAPADTYTSTALVQAGADECRPTGTNMAIASVDFAGGVFVVTFKSLAVTAADASATVSYHVRMRETYNAADEQTSAGDSYTNKVALTGTTTPIATGLESGTQVLKDVKDDSEATIASSAPKLDKRILRNTSADHSCADNTWQTGSTGNWFNDQAAADDAPFTPGSRVCFQVRVSFPTSSSTRLPVVTDYLPDNLTYEAGSFELVPGVNTAPMTLNQADEDEIDAAFVKGTASLRPGTEIDGTRYVAKGQVFAFRLSAIVQSNEKSAVDVQGNLAKLRWTSHSGRVWSLRDTADFRVPPVPPVVVDKQVAKTNPLGTYADSQTVIHGDTVRFRVGVTNQGTTPVGDLNVWDVLPAPFTCASVSGITNGGTCTDPGATGHPMFAGSTASSAIRWVLPASVVAGGTTGVTYDVTVPTTTSVGTSYENAAYVRSFTTSTNRDDVPKIRHYPSANVDSSVPAASQDAPAARDVASVALPKVALSKSNTTGVNATGNALVGQAVPGETVTYTVQARIPARTTVYNGVLTDPMPTDLTFVSSTAGYSAVNTDPATDELPVGAVFSPATAQLTLPTTFTNASDSDQVFQINIVAKLLPAVTDTTVRTNTATFKSRTQLAPSGVPVADVTASSAVTPVHPAPAISKALTTSPAQNATVSGGDSRQYILKASNGAGKPSLYDSRVVDCVPTGLIVTTLPQAASQAPTVANDACSAVVGTGTTIIWETGTIDAGVTTSLTYTVQVSVDAAAGQVYKNTASLTGSSLADGTLNTSNEQVISATSSLPLTVPSGTIGKAIADSTLAVGERAEYTLTATLPVKAQYFNSSVSDTLPAGLDPASVVTTSVECTDAAGCALPSNGAAMKTSGQTVGWSFGDLASSDNVRTIKVKFSALVADNCVGTQTSCNTIGRSRSNTANLRWDLTNKAEPANASSAQDKSVASSPAVTFTVQEPQTAITKSASSTTPAPGDTFTYTVVASNTGGTNVSDAHNVVVKDVVPAGVVIDESTISGSGTYDAETRTITWNVSLLTAAAGANHAKTFTYGAKLAASSAINGTGLKNTATVTAFQSTATGGRSYTGSSASATVTPQLPHTSVAKRVVGSDVSYVGEPQTFEVVVTNDGESPAYDIDVADVLPKSWQLGAAQVKVGDAATVTVPPTTDDAGNPQTVTWDDLAPSGLAVGKTIVITYVATPLPGALTDAGAGSTKAHTNTVTINAEDKTGATSSGKGSYHGGPATATARIHSADLAIDKTAVGTPVAGDSFSWTIEVTNNGDDPAVGPIVVTDTIPAHVTNYSVSGTGWTCTSSTTVWTCTRPGPIADDGAAPDLTATGTIDADLANGADVVNTATVSGRTHDPVNSNDSSTATVGVTTLADLKLAKSLTGIITAGQSATWTLDVRNLGPSTSRGPITVKDTLPDDATFVSAEGEGWTCAEKAGVVTCERTTDLPASGASAAGQITIVAKISAAQKAAVVNTATVSGTTTEPGTTTAEANNTDTVSTTPTRRADLFLQKSLVSATAAVPGTDLTYELEVTNNGPSTATGVTITDTLPDYMTYVSGGNADWDCSADGQDVTCELDGSLGVADDEVASVEIVANVASGRTGPIVNAARAVATEDPAGSADDDTNTPTLKSDLTIAKSHRGDATAGTSITYSVTVKNAGPSDTAGPIVVEDTVPTGMTYTSATGTGWACEEEDGTVTCTHAGGLTNGSSRTLALTFEVAVDAGPASVVNNVTVDGPNTDPEIDNSTATDPTDIVDDANLTITKTSSGATTHAGTQSSWAIDVVNEGPSTADNVSVSDLLPAGLTIDSISGTGWACDQTTLTCTRPTLAPGAAPSITAVTTVGSGVASGSELVNAAEVSTSTEDEDDLDDNEDSDDIGVTTSADLALDKSHTGTPVAGRAFSFDLAARNDGPSDALGPITISDKLPVGMTYTAANEAWSCLAAPVSSSGQDVLCTLVSGGPIIAGDDVPNLTMVVDVQSDQSGATLVNTAEIDSSTPDPTADDNGDSDTVVPTDAVDLTLTKSHVGPVRIGDQLAFVLGVANHGPSEARDVTVTDALPKGLTLVSAKGAGWTCASGACALDEPLAPADATEPLTVVVEVAPEAYPDVTNVATVTTSSHETKPADNEAKDDVVVPAQVDLSVVKQAVGELRVGERADYSLTVHNAGPTGDPGAVTVTDQLPAGLTYVEAKATGWECGALAQLVTCTRTGDLAVDATETIAVTVDVAAAAYPSVSNSAQVSSSAEDTNHDDNSATTTSPVAGRAALALAKSLGSQDGSTAVWTIAVRNTGPTETTAPLVVVDKLPEGLAFRGAAGDGWACVTPAGVVTCTYAGALPVGVTASMEVTTKITVDDGSEIVNVATVQGGDAVVRSAALSDDALVTAPDGDDATDDHAGGLLPDTGGVAFWLLLAGLVLVLAGGTLVTRRRRPTDLRR